MTDIRENLNVEYAGFWSRVGAAILDSIILSPIVIILWYLDLNHILWISILATLIQASYKTLMEWYYGGTLGKRISKILIINKQGELITLKESFIRNILYNISHLLALLPLFFPVLFEESDFLSFDVNDLTFPNSIVLANIFVSFLLLLSCLFVPFTSFQQSGHDFFAPTFCIKERCFHMISENEINSIGLSEDVV